MARGWESKAVESQMESAKAEQKQSGRKRMTPEAAARLRKKETLLLARAHLQQQLQKAQHTRHQEMLQNALADVEKQLAELTGTAHAAANA